MIVKRIIKATMVIKHLVEIMMSGKIILNGFNVILKKIKSNRGAKK